MSILTASSISVFLCAIVPGQGGQTQAEQSKKLLIQWAQLVEACSSHNLQSLRERSTSLDSDFERLNGGTDGSLAVLAGVLRGNDLPARRAAATVIGSIRVGIGSSADGLVFRSKELSFSGK